MKPSTDTAVPADATREKPQPAPVTQQCGDTKRGAVVDWVCTKEHGHKGAHTDGSASWFDDRAYLQIQHARKQGDADGFQKGWHAALTRIREGDSTDELIALVPAPATVTDEDAT